MEYLIASFVILLTTVCLYYIGGIRRLRLLGILVGLVFVLPRLLLHDELSSTPANYTLYSQMNARITTYFLVFYPEMKTSVIECEWNEQRTLRSPGFETEGATEIWIVTTHGNNSIAALNKIADKKSEAKVFVIGEKSYLDISKEDQERAIKLMKSYRIESYATTVVLILNSLLVILLLLKRNKGSKTLSQFRETRSLNFTH